jgi:hypothetical protein
MSVSTEVQRTLVKSPPELWAELSSPEALARHLGELGDIRITQVEPETKVEWESDGATGVVQLKPSGWGTKVTLSVTRNPPVTEEPSEAEPTAETGPESVGEPESKPTPEPEPEAAAVVEPDLPPPAAEPEPMEEQDSIAIVEQDAEDERQAIVSADPGADPKLGFFARLFHRRRRKLAKGVEREPETAVATKPEPIAVVGPEVEPEPERELVALAAPEPTYPAPPVEPAIDLASELESVEAQMSEETTELLTGVLDRLGAAHHRPFSRG